MTSSWSGSPDCRKIVYTGDNRVETFVAHRLGKGDETILHMECW